MLHNPLSYFRKVTNRTTALVGKYLPPLANMSDIPFEPKSFGIAFDVDGVLCRGSEVIPGVSDTLHKLTALQVPFIALTNGGGSSEADKAASLSQRFGITLSPKQVVLAHTPMTDLAVKHRGDLILVVGKKYDKLKDLALQYGFTRVVTPEDIHLACPQVYPDMPPINTPPLVPTPPPHHHPTTTSPGGGGERHQEVAAVLVMTDPIFWGRELQVCMDVLRPRQAGTPQIPVYSGAADLEYSTELPTPRLGAGAFMVALQAIYAQATGMELEVTRFGKPHSLTFQYAEKILIEMMEAKNSCQDSSRKETEGYLHQWYMIGDNPLTDIRGANLAGSKWKSILTRTGMFQGGVNDEDNPADVVVGDANEAVDWILEFENLEQIKL